ncbi:hypothetical protein [Brucella grignonensis]|nr:hypothetical protein [Brucella grignonensis]
MFATGPLQSGLPFLGRDIVEQVEDSMNFTCETCIKLENAETAIRKAFGSLQPHCCAQTRSGHDYAFDFCSAKAVVRADSHILWIRIEAEEFIIAVGAKILIQSEIAIHSKDVPENWLWIEATDDPFAAITSFEGQEGSRAAGGSSVTPE